MKTTLHPSYFPSITTFAVIVQKDVVWEAHDNFQKQTYRNRCYICTDRGKHMLNIPITHVGGKDGRQKYRGVEIDNSSNWQKQHWRTLETAYRTSPFFEFYEDDLRSLFKEPVQSLYNFNLETINVLCECLGVQSPSMFTNTFEKTTSNTYDARFLVEAKKPLDITTTPYSQVFEERHGFVPNLSILDLLFNEGTNALDYLKNQPLDFLNA
ncbi:WbqC family protein [Flagellimonas pacifica]|uniref:WbqC-like protein family protein n=1 Tax=Flagellimonas pacifica TaxID=1247520 RepID=A0A285MTC9_9FLAO|nr:WbqC family protein [Allomuricauda parva]SNZ00388.1 WbqC-like protein family protein [Allomuricauda parva]